MTGAAVCGGLLSAYFKPAIVLLASGAIAVSGVLHATTADAGVVATLVFVVALLAVLQAAYVAGVMLLFRSRK